MTITDDDSCLCEADPCGHDVAEIYNDAAEDYSPNAEYSGNHDGNFVLQCDYFASPGLDALREEGWKVYTVEPVCLHDCEWADQDEYPQVVLYIRKRDSVEKSGDGSGKK